MARQATWVLELWDDGGVPWKRIAWIGPPPPTYEVPVLVGSGLPLVFDDAGATPDAPHVRRRMFRRRLEQSWGSGVLIYDEETV